MWQEQRSQPVFLMWFPGRAVASFRKEAVIATKFGIVDESFFTGNEDALNSSRDSIRQQVDASLKRLGTDYTDLYYQHRIDPGTEPEITFSIEPTAAYPTTYNGLLEVSREEESNPHGDFRNG